MRLGNNRQYQAQCPHRKEKQEYFLTIEIKRYPLKIKYNLTLRKKVT